uniref:Uncharacterized protein n=1 Tax=Arundo donax TaxID=35708 RepID=A0A0A8XXS8_ARUDO
MTLQLQLVMLDTDSFSRAIRIYFSPVDFSM